MSTNSQNVTRPRRFRPEIVSAYVAIQIVVLAGADRSALAQVKPAVVAPSANVNPLARLGSAYLRHDHSVQSLAFSGDDGTLISAGNDFTVRGWSTKVGTESFRYSPFPNRNDPFASTRMFRSVVFLGDGKSVAAANDKTVYLWDSTTGKEIRKLEGHESPVESLALSGDKKLLASGSGNVIRLWEPGTGKIARQFAAAREVTSLCFSPSGQTLASAASDGSLQIWDVATAKELRAIDAHEGAIRAMAFSAGGKQLATAGNDKVIRTWDVSPQANPQISPFILSGVPWGRQPGFIPIFQTLDFLRLQRPVAEMKGHQDAVTSLVHAPAGNTLYSASHDGTIRSWNPIDGVAIAKFEGFAGSVNCLAVSHDGTILASGNEFGSIQLWDARTRKAISPSEGHAASIDSVAFVAGGSALFTIAKDLSIREWQITGAKLINSPPAVPDASAVAVSTDRKTLAIGTGQGEIRLILANDLKEIKKIAGHQGPVLSIQFSADGKLLASGGEDRIARLWSSATGGAVAVLGKHEAPIRLLHFSPNGKLLAAGGIHEMVKVWSTEEGTQLHQIGEHGAEAHCFCFVAEGSLLALGSRDGIVRLWDTTTGKLVRQFEGHPGYVLAVAASHDGKTLAVGSWLSIRLWEISSGKERARFDGQPGDVTALQFSSDGRRLAAGLGNSTAAIYDLTGQLKNGTLPAPGLSTKELDSLWTDLQSENAAQAYQATWKLVASEKTGVDFLRARLKPDPIVPEEEHKRIAKIIARLEQDDFDAREKAGQELEILGRSAEYELRRTLEGSPSAELARRVESLVEKLNAPPKILERLRVQRAFEILELMNSDGSLALLEAMAKGDPHSVLTQESAAAVVRLGKRKRSGRD